MLIETRAMDFTLTDSLRNHVESRVTAALAPVDRWVVSVTARLEDVNADHGGVDKRCKLVIGLRKYGTLVAEATESDLYVAIDQAADRIRTSAVKAVRRHTPAERHDRQRPGALV